MGPSNHDVGRATRGEGRAFLGSNWRGGRGKGVRHVLASAMDAARNRAEAGEPGSFRRRVEGLGLAWSGLFAAWWLVVAR